jgi:hypothetical protein
MRSNVFKNALEQILGACESFAQVSHAGMLKVLRCCATAFEGNADVQLCVTS